MTHEEVMEACPNTLGECLYLEVQEGWLPTLLKFGEILEDFGNKTGVQVVAEQVKQKYGELRFYHRIENRDDKPDNYVKHLTEVVRFMELACDITCERCGQYGTTRGGSWVMCLCEVCANK